MEATVPLKVQEAIFDQILNHPENRVCADCPNKSPSWASIDFGVFICLRCAGVHRQLGPSVTRVRSAKLDSWNMEHIEILAAVGNKIANDYWEYSLPSYHKKPDITASMEDVRKSVNEKYIKRLFAPKDQQNPVEEYVGAKKNNQVTAGAFRQQKLTPQKGGSSIQTKPVEETTVTAKPEIKTKVPTQNLIDFDEPDDGFTNFTTAPEKTTKQEFSKHDNGFNFNTNNGTSQKFNAFSLFSGNFQAPTSDQNVPLQKTKSADPFQFTDNKPQQQPLATVQKSQSQIDSSNLYSLYKIGNTVDLSINSQTSNQNFSGGKSNYAYLDMLGNQSQQSKSVQQQGFGYQNNSFGQAPTNQFSGGAQNGIVGGYSGQTTQNKPSTGFDFGGSNKGFNTGYGGGFNGPSFNSNGGFGVQQQPQQSFLPNSNTTSTPFSFNPGSTSSGFPQKSSTNTNFFF